ncbi:MAG: heme ABC exporter ATP-binding protein CcmA [Vicinamibacterales bacterium]
MPALCAQGLSKHFGATRAVTDVSFEVEPGEVVGLLGANGAGKTTTLRMLAGVLRPDSGRVTVDGIDVHQSPLEAKRRLGFLSGDTQLYQRLSPREVLAYFGDLYGIDRASAAARIDQLVGELEMAPFADRPCGTLSAGQKQRANIARAFLHAPPVLVLDEPTNALDVISGRFIVEAIVRERQRGTAVLLSTHIMSEAEYVCDRLLLMHEGRIHKAGRVDEIVAATGRANLTDAFLAAIGAAPTIP